MSDQDAQVDTRITLYLFFGIFLLIGVDVASDLYSGAALAHILIEGSILALATVGTARIVLSYVRANRKVTRLNSALLASREETQQWKQETKDLLAGLGEAVDVQFKRWELTRAESEVGLLLLKGLSLREIASLRAVSERTVRDQARAIYRKGKLEGRAELSAFFLEDLLLPRAQKEDHADSAP